MFIKLTIHLKPSEETLNRLENLQLPITKNLQSLRLLISSIQAYYKDSSEHEDLGTVIETTSGTYVVDESVDYLDSILIPQLDLNRTTIANRFGGICDVVFSNKNQ